MRRSWVGYFLGPETAESPTFALILNRELETLVVGSWVPRVGAKFKLLQRSCILLGPRLKAVTNYSRLP